MIPFDQLLQQARANQEDPEQIPSGSSSQTITSTPMIPLETPGLLPPDTLMEDEEAHAYDNVSDSNDSEEESPEKPVPGQGCGSVR